jgi:hypothetical protein
MAGPNDKAHRDDASKKHAPTDGPSADDRGPDPQRDQEAALRAANIAIAHDRPSQVLHVEVKGPGCMITLGSGSQHGVTEYMQGYLKSDAGPFATFIITEVGEKTSRAFVDLTPDAVAQHQGAIINASHMPKPAPTHNVRATLLHVEVTPNGTRIKFSKGERQDVGFGTKGVVVDASGKELADFVVDELHPQFSGARVDLTPDQLNGAKVVLR